MPMYRVSMEENQIESSVSRKRWPQCSRLGQVLMFRVGPQIWGLDGAPWSDRRVLARGEPPFAVTANQDVERHF